MSTFGLQAAHLEHVDDAERRATALLAVRYVEAGRKSLRLAQARRLSPAAGGSRLGS